jgi:hypothetical protein
MHTIGSFDDADAGDDGPALQPKPKFIVVSSEKKKKKKNRLFAASPFPSQKRKRLGIVAERKSRNVLKTSPIRPIRPWGKNKCGAKQL